MADAAEDGIADGAVDADALADVLSVALAAGALELEAALLALEPADDGPISLGGGVLLSQPKHGNVARLRARTKLRSRMARPTLRRSAATNEPEFQ